MDLGPLVVMGLAWLVVNALRKSGSTPPTGKTPPRPPPPVPRPKLPGARGTPARPGASARTARPPSVPGGATLDPTQVEGARLDRLLRQLGRTLEDAAGPAGRRPDRALPSAEEAEDGESLEVAPEVQSLETDAERPARSVVDQDDEAERIVARRMQAAEARLAPRTRAEHQAFDARIRAEPVDRTPTGPNRVKQLRAAMVWREILGPPVSLRQDEDR